MSNIDERAYRDAMALYATGVSIITADDGTQAHGLTASSFTSVSLKPPLLLVCVNETSAFLSIVRGAKRFALNILRERQTALATLFATAAQSDRQDALLRLPDAPPRLTEPEGPLVRFDCLLRDERIAGDHSVLIAEPIAIERAIDDQPLVWWRGSLEARIVAK